MICALIYTTLEFGVLNFGSRWSFVDTISTKGIFSPDLYTLYGNELILLIDIY